MKIQFSFLDKGRSFIGFEISRGARLFLENKEKAQLQRTLDISIGYLFGWITLQFDLGGKFYMDDIFEDMINKIEKEKTL